jgi:hypothetical protein
LIPVRSPQCLARIFHQRHGRVGCDAVRWQGVTTLRARAREAETGHKQSLRTVCACRGPKPLALAEQRGQRAVARLNRVCSARTKLDLALEAKKLSIHTVLRGIEERPGEICGLVCEIIGSFWDRLNRWAPRWRAAKRHSSAVANSGRSAELVTQTNGGTNVGFRRCGTGH